MKMIAWFFAATTVLVSSAALASNVPSIPAPAPGLQVGGDASSTHITPTGASAGRSAASHAADLLSIADFSAVCDGVTNVASAVDAAVSAGAKRVYIPKNCLYIPDSNTTPSNVELIGEDWNSSTLSVANRSTDTLLLGSHSIVRNLAVISHFCDTTPYPAGTAKVCPVGEARNTADAASALTNWVYEPIFLTSGPSSTGPTGVTTIDTPIIAILQAGSGSDGIYAASGGVSSANGNTSALRVVTNGSNDNGIYGLNGFYGSGTAEHTFIRAKEFSDNSHGSKTIYVDRSPPSGQDVAPSIWVDDADSVNTTNTSPFVDFVVSHQGSGNLFNVYHATNPFSGDVIHDNMGNAGGAFTGNFLNFAIAGSTVFKIGPDGTLTSAVGATYGGLLTLNGGLTVPTGEPAIFNGNVTYNTGAVLFNNGLTTAGLTSSAFSNLQGNGYLAGSSGAFLSWTGQGAGGTPSLNAQGTNTSVDVELVGKGSFGSRLNTYQLGGIPTTANIPASRLLGWKDTNAGGGVRIYTNDGGTIKSAALTAGLVSLAAAGTTQATATPLTSENSNVSSGTGGVVLDAEDVGIWQEVFNRSGAAITVYPFSGAQIESNAANAGVSLVNGGHARFLCTSSFCLQAS